MRYDDLFHATASLDEPPVPVDVAGGVVRAQARHRVRLAAVGAPLLGLAVAAAVVLPQRGGSQPAGVVPAVTGPSSYVGIVGDHAVRVDASTGQQTSLGRASAVTTRGETVLLSTPTRACHDRVHGGAVSFEAGGAVGAMALSPDGTQLAYSRGRETPAGSYQPGGDCGADSLVIRDLSSGTERVWPEDAGEMSSLSWSADGRHLAFQLSVCCTDGEVVHTLDTTTAPVGIARLPEIKDTEHGACRDRLPTWAGTRLLVVLQCIPHEGPETNEIRDSTKVLLTLTGTVDHVSAAPTGKRLLVTFYGSPDKAGTTRVYDLGTGSSTPSADGVSNPTWSS